MSKVLIINHSEDTMELLKMYLSKKGLDVKCSGEEEAMPLMKEYKPDVVLIDVLQNEVAIKIKEDEKLSNTPIVLMTGHVKDNFKNIADDVIAKPFEPKELEKKIKKFLKRTG
jgi:DNA-binding response OmpR family regulator